MSAWADSWVAAFPLEHKGERLFLVELAPATEAQLSIRFDDLLILDPNQAITIAAAAMQHEGRVGGSSSTAARGYDGLVMLDHGDQHIAVGPSPNEVIDIVFGCCASGPLFYNRSLDGDHYHVMMTVKGLSANVTLTVTTTQGEGVQVEEQTTTSDLIVTAMYPRDDEWDPMLSAYAGLGGAALLSTSFQLDSPRNSAILLTTGHGSHGSTEGPGYSCSSIATGRFMHHLPIGTHDVSATLTPAWTYSWAFLAVFQLPGHEREAPPTCVSL